jgi:hypothetical protein
VGCKGQKMPFKSRKRNSTRAGKRNCRRCCLTWNRSKGDASTICPDCKGRCSRCNVELTEENTSVCTKRKGAFRCKACIIEGVKLTEGNAGGIRRDNYLVKKYGITLPEYEALLAIQEGVCCICERPPKEDVEDGRRALHVDHRHVPNDKKQSAMNTRTRVRGLLCWRCNASLQKFRDDPELMRKAADYVEQEPAQKYLKEIEHGN